MRAVFLVAAPPGGRVGRRRVGAVPIAPQTVVAPELRSAGKGGKEEMVGERHLEVLGGMRCSRVGIGRGCAVVRCNFPEGNAIGGARLRHDRRALDRCQLDADRSAIWWIVRLHHVADVFAVARVERRTRARAEVTRSDAVPRQGGATGRRDAVESDAVDLLHERLDGAGRLLRRCGRGLVSGERGIITGGVFFLRTVAASGQFRHLRISICSKIGSVETMLG